MNKIIEKHVEDSKTEQIQIIMLEHLNGYNRLFGGKLMEWIDVVAAVVARRHSNCNVTTVCIDNLHFKEPIHVNDTVVLIGTITYVGHTSMEVRVETFVEALCGTKQLVNRAYVVMVALDDNEKPTKIPSLIIETDEEKKEWNDGLKRNSIRKQRRNENF